MIEDMNDKDILDKARMEGMNQGKAAIDAHDAARTEKGRGIIPCMV